MSDGKTEVISDILRDMVVPMESIGRVLVVGCGDGSEACTLARELQPVTVDAIDTGGYFQFAHPRVTFHRMDARAMDFPDGTFDIVYSFHALEHIPEPERAIREIRRVLRDCGMFFIGVPNRQRLLGYFTGRDATLRDKVAWNLIDWWARLRGRFRNEFGAHAGFSLEELDVLCSRIGRCMSITPIYYEMLYPAFRKTIKYLLLFGVWRVVFPCLYYVGRKSPVKDFIFT
jgi:SAM-dependent methyltransferase